MDVLRMRNLRPRCRPSVLPTTKYFRQFLIMQLCSLLFFEFEITLFNLLKYF